MAGKQAKILSTVQIERLLAYASKTRHPDRDRLIVLLSVRAGLRAGEIAKLTWEMVLDADGSIGAAIELHDCAAKKGSGRRIPLHSDLQTAFASTQRGLLPSIYVVASERCGGMTPSGVVQWFRRAYRALGFAGCSSHSGRRTFVTRAARLVYAAGGSLRDVQVLAGHRSIQTTERYIEGDTDAQRRLVALI